MSQNYQERPFGVVLQCINLLFESKWRWEQYRNWLRIALQEAPPHHHHHFSQQKQDQVNQLLAKWKCVFAQDEEDFSETSTVLHQIPTGSAPPTGEQYRTVPPSLYQELRSLLQTMLIQESSNPWAAPVILVKKKSGAWRCVDYRGINALTHKDAYPLPRIEEALTTLNQAEWYATLNLASGYWQVKMWTADQEKLHSPPPSGCMSSKRMPFGVYNALATFQRLMQRCLGSQVNDSLLTYLDDVIVYSKPFDMHLTHLDRVFQKLYDHGLKLQPKKCTLFPSEVTYLGHQVSQQGVAPNLDRIKTGHPPPLKRRCALFLGVWVIIEGLSPLLPRSPPLCMRSHMVPNSWVPRSSQNWNYLHWNGL